MKGHGGVRLAGEISCKTFSVTAVSHPVYNDSMRCILRLLLIFGIVVLGVGIVRGRSSLTDRYRLAHSAAVLRQQLAQLAAENRELADEISKIKNSRSYARRVLRDRYHLTEQGENIVFFAD